MGLVDKLWYKNHPLAWLAAPLLWPLRLLFSVLSRRRRAAFLSGRSPSYRPPVPVVMVGNITAGGNGKTPVVIWLVEQLKAAGMKPGVVSRGYGGNAKNYPVVLNNKSGPEMAGDEPVLIYQRTGVPVAISPKRCEAVKALLALGVDIIITDDGLQHYKLARDIEFVVVDGARRFGNGHLIPQGPLREKTDRLETVDFIVCNGGQAQCGEISMYLKPHLLVNLKTGQKVEANTLSNAVAMAGIGHPQRFFNTLLAQGVSLQHCAPFSDHHRFDFVQLDALASRGEHLIMTEKDAVKCRTWVQNRQDIDNWWYLPVDAHFSLQDTALIIETIKKVKDRYGSPTA